MIIKVLELSDVPPLNDSPMPTRNENAEHVKSIAFRPMVISFD